MKPRETIVERFSTFLFIIDSYKFTVQWQTDYQLKVNINKIIDRRNIEGEKLAYQLLNNLRLNFALIIKNHLTSYLQEVCYWATKQVYNSIHNNVNSLTLSECFLWGNEAIIQPEKLLKKYEFNKGSKITTYAQTRLKTIIKDKVYISRGWKLLTNWGLLKKIAKSKREEVLKQIGGLRGEKLEEYLLAWQCFVDNYVSSSPHKNKSLSSPSLSLLKRMTNQYNLLAKNRLDFPSELTVENFEMILKFCGEKARLFVNPISIEYLEDEEINQDDNFQYYSTFLEDNREEIEINQILITAFNNLNLSSQSIFYLAQGLNFTQQQIIQTIRLTYPDFTKEQYQLSKNTEKIRKLLLDEVIKSVKKEKGKIAKETVKPLIQLLKQWLTEYIDSEMLLLCQKSYQEMETEQQKLLKESCFQSSLDKSSFVDKIPSQLVNLLRENFNEKLNLKLREDIMINDHLYLWLEKFCHHYFYQQ
ncbi:hypothetical protein [Geminocystis sp. NIES-3709]|uniref:hypothetical protein n=1 Tax=Geminocystis sp. NIES-3709 TaxID=1617448 RepID=UPI0005FC97FF|nr:hypothetical protein [Geminocystis sp. NIES-3709]BAQ65278.1 hypothetical protein GM3709_2043 [Geminocystis sp. NIES-3709]